MQDLERFAICCQLMTQVVASEWERRPPRALWDQQALVHLESLETSGFNIE